jgi:DNA helicase II / ATP-dependent DNA helicase PcrA
LQVYEDYQEALRASGALDFDDLLVWGLRLFTKAPEVLEGIRHIFVDEFQVSSSSFRRLSYPVD